MAKLYYGNGTCTIEEGEIIVLIIVYSGAIEIDDKTPDGFAINANDNKIMIFPINSTETLTELFNYEGELNITEVRATNKDAGQEPCTVHRVMDYSQLLTSTAETMTTKAEDLSSGYLSGKVVNKTILKQPVFPNLNTSTHNGNLYLEDGSVYNGDYHIHLSDSALMTGKIYDETSQALYFKQALNGEIIDKLVPTKNPSHIPPSLRLKRKHPITRMDRYAKKINLKNLKKPKISPGRRKRRA